MMAFQPLCHRGTIVMQRMVYKHGIIRSSSSSSAASYMSTYIPPTITFRDEDVAMKNTIQQKVRKRLDVALVGAPNAGKSQLLNSLIGSKVAAVSRKRHTTRMGILGARTFEDDEESTQVVFIDTPGFLHHKMGVKEGIRKLLGEASAEMESADFTLLVVDAAKTLEEDMKRTLITLIFLALRSKGRNENAVRNKETDTTNNPDAAASQQLNKFAVVINKCDLVHPKEKLLAVAADVGSVAESCIRRLLQQHRSPSKVRLGDLVDSVYENHTEEEGFDGVHDDDIETFAAVVPEFMFTAAIDKDDEGVEDVLGLLLDRATPSKEWIVDPESITGLSPVEQVEEIIREKVYRCLHREVPHAVQQQNRMFRLIEPDERKSDIGKEALLRIHQDLVVRTKSHQRLVLGSGGKTLERIRSTAHKDLEEAFGCEVDLNLNVRISKSNNTEVPLEADGGTSSNFPI